MSEHSTRLLIAASGTGGHLFPALALAEQLNEYEIEWLGVPDRLEQTLVPDCYPLHTIPVTGFQTRFGWNSVTIFSRLIAAIFQVRRLLREKNIHLIFTTGGYIAAPAIIAAKLQGIPVIIHEANFLPGKVTRWFGGFCKAIALGMSGTAQYFPKTPTVYVSTPVRKQFHQSQPLDLPIPTDVLVIVVVGGSQGAVAVNKLVRQCLKAWLAAGAAVIHLTGDRDTEEHPPHQTAYFPMAFSDNMAGILQRADLAISRAGAGTLTELAFTQTPAILIPYPYGAENHQALNAKVFGDAGAALVYSESELTASMLESVVLDLLQQPERLQEMGMKTANLAVKDSAERLATLVRQTIHFKC